MIRENTNVKHTDNERIAMKLMTGDPSSLRMTGQITDRIYKNGVLVEEIVGHNLVVNSFLKLVMCLLKQQGGYSGIQYWAVGSGAPTWDSSIPTPELDASRLTTEIGRVPISVNEIKFLNSNFDEVSTPTNIIEIKHTFSENDCNGIWREFAIFGGNATAEANSGIMLNKRHHAVITKTNEMVIERTMRFTLTLV